MSLQRDLMLLVLQWENIWNTKHSLLESIEAVLSHWVCLSHVPTPSTRKRLSYVNICKNRNRLRMFHGVVWNHVLPADYAYQQCLWSSNKSSNMGRLMVSTVLRNILNVSVHTLPYAWPHTNRKSSMALQLMHKPCPMIWNITLWIMRNTREVVCAGFLALVPPQKRTAY